MWEKGKTNKKVPQFVNFEKPYRNDENSFLLQILLLIFEYLAVEFSGQQNVGI